MVKQEVSEIIEKLQCDELEAVNALLQIITQEEEELIKDLEETFLKAA